MHFTTFLASIRWSTRCATKPCRFFQYFSCHSVQNIENQLTLFSGSFFCFLLFFRCLDYSYTIFFPRSSSFIYHFANFNFCLLLLVVFFQVFLSSPDNIRRVSFQYSVCIRYMKRCSCFIVFVPSFDSWIGVFSSGYHQFVLYLLRPLHVELVARLQSKLVVRRAVH